MIQNLHFRKALIQNEIENARTEISKNNEFIRLFQKNNEELISKIKNNLKEVEEISWKLDEQEAEILIKQNL
jgi:uncharacterized protein YcgL (UPF0745 family)